MGRSVLGQLAALPAYRALFAVSVLIGLRDAMVEPFIILFAVEHAHMGPLALGAFLTARALGSIAASMLLGTWFDRRPSVWPLRTALLAGVAGALLCLATTRLDLLLIVAAGPLAVGAAAFPQSFSLARLVLDDAHRHLAERGTAVLRSSFSIAWGVGPMLGALVVGGDGYGRVFAAAAACGAAALVTLALSGVRMPRNLAGRPLPRLSREGAAGLGLVTAAFTLFFMTLCMDAAAMPVVVTRDLGGAPVDVGVTSSLCAALEVPVMLAVAIRPALWGGFRGLVIGAIAMALYHAAAGVAPTVPLFVATQLLRAVGIGFVACIGISHMQDLMPGRAGAAAALFTVTGQAGALLAGLAVGGWADLYGYRSVFLIAAAIGGVSLGLLILSRRGAVRTTEGEARA